MSYPFRTLVVRTCIALSAAALIGGTAAAGASSARDVYAPEMEAPRATESPVGSKSARDARTRGAAFLKTIQKSDGGWGAGSWGQADGGAPSDVATSAITLLALHRDANGSDVHREAIARGVKYVLAAIDSAPRDSARVSTPENTQPQYKLGKLVDTHMAAMMLTELANTLDAETNRSMDKGLGQVIAKVQLAQRQDGSFDGDGWAPVLSNSIAASSLLKARDQGVVVSDDVLDRSEKYQAAQLKGDGSFDTSTGAGVELYSVAGSLRTNSLASKREGSGNAPAAEKAAEASVGRVTGDVDGRLMAGFGSVGGEEMLGYMLISDTLAEDEPTAFAKWDRKVGEYLAGIQNADGSWVGHHCITSTTFTTAAAVMTLGSADYAQRQAARATASGLKKG